MSINHFYSPRTPSCMDWGKLYPKYFENGTNDDEKTRRVEFADIGCGYGGLLGENNRFISSLNTLE